MTMTLFFLVFQMLEGRSYKLQFPWIGVVNRSQADINKSVDMIAARRREYEYFANSPEYRHLANRMGSEHLGKMLSKVCMVPLTGLEIYMILLFFGGYKIFMEIQSL